MRSPSRNPNVRLEPKGLDPKIEVSKDSQVYIQFIALTMLALLASCTQEKTFLRKDGTYAYKGECFKERW